MILMTMMTIDDNWCEVVDRLSGVTDILLQEPAIAESGDNCSIIIKIKIHLIAIQD